MVVNKRKKVVRYRGSKTHGGGAKKKRRGAGNRGGKGMAGTGKRADTKKPMIWKNKKYFGRYGFVNQNRRRVRAINIGFIENHLENFKDKIEFKDGVYHIDLKKLGYEKLLGGGSVSNKYAITAEYVSRKAEEKIIKAGGSVKTPESGLKDVNA